MAQSRLAGMGYTGIAALIFIEMMEYGKKQETYEEMRRSQHKLYAFLRAHLPEVYNKESKYEDYNENIAPLLDEAAYKIEETRQLYKSQFEGLRSWTEEEAIFQVSLDGSFEHLCMIAAKSKILDKIKMDDTEMIG
jgi:predicted nuclease with TOPRIM domain